MKVRLKSHQCRDSCWWVDMSYLWTELSNPSVIGNEQIEIWQNPLNKSVKPWSFTPNSITMKLPLSSWHSSPHFFMHNCIFFKLLNATRGIPEFVHAQICKTNKGYSKDFDTKIFDFLIQDRKSQSKNLDTSPDTIRHPILFYDCFYCLCTKIDPGASEAFSGTISPLPRHLLVALPPGPSEFRAGNRPLPYNHWLPCENGEQIYKMIWTFIDIRLIKRNALY